MKIMLSNVLAMFALAVAIGCRTSSPDIKEPAQASLLNGSRHILMVDWSCKHPPVGSPDSKLQESHYNKDTQGTTYLIEFSADGQAVKVAMDETIEGSLASDIDGIKTYSLETFAGGHLVIRPAGAHYEAELTIYGSGVPIISSVRGKLVKK